MPTEYLVFLSAPLIFLTFNVDNSFAVNSKTWISLLKVSEIKINENKKIFKMYKNLNYGINIIFGAEQVPLCISLKASAPAFNSLNSIQFKSPTLPLDSIFKVSSKSLLV